MRSLWAAGFLLRRLRTEVGVVALLVALVALTSFLFAGAPRLFNLIADAALVDQLRSAAVVDRDLELSSTAISPVAPSDPDPLAAVDDLSGEYLAAFPDSIARLIGERRFSITSPRFWLPVPPRYPTYLSLRYQDGLDGAIRLVAGRLPASNGEPLPVATLEFDVEPPPLPATPPRIEIAVSEATAAEIGVDIGTTLAVRLDGTSPTVRGFVLRLIEAEFRVVGIFAVDDPEAEIWYENRALQRPEIGGSDENPIAYATALVAPEAYADLAASRLPFQFAWRFFLTPERADVGQLDRLVPDLRRIQAVNADATFGSYLPGTLVLRTGLVGVIERYLAARSAAEAVLTVAAIGPFALAVGAIAMLAVLLVIRRRASLELARGRGASGLLVLAAQLWEGVLLAGGASLGGLLLAVQLVPGRGSSLSQWLAIATAAAAALAMVAATWPVVRRRLGPAGREDAAVLPASPRRLVLELTGVGLAVAGVLLLQQRGLVIGDRQFGEPVRLDPFLAAVPVLAGLAMGIVAMRLYPIPVRAFSWLAARRRDLVPVLGLRNVGRHGAAANLPLLVLMLTAAFGAFASVVLSSIDHGQADAAWRQVGADYRIELGPSGEGRAIDPTQVEAVQAVAGAYLDQSTTFSDTPSQRSQVVLDAIDADAYQRVVDGSSIAFTWPRGFTDAPTPAGAAGTPEAPIPAIVSERLPSGSGPLARGDPFEVDVGIHTLSFVVVGRQASFPGVRPNAAFVIVSLDLLQEVQPEGPLSPNVLFVRAAGDAGPGLARITEGSASTIVSRYERHEELRSAPLVAMVIGGFRIALLVAVAYAALAIVGALTLTASRRSQDLAFLRTLGLSARQALGLTVLEQGPPVVLALIPGVALGIWIAVLLATGLGLSAFVGDEEAIAISVSWGEIALVGGSLVMMVTIAGAASTWLARRARAVDALRLGGD